MAKIKKGKAKGAEQPTKAQPAEPKIDMLPAAVPVVIALHPSGKGHNTHTKSSVAHEEYGHGGHWPAPAHDADEDEEDEEWGGEDATASGDLWGKPPPSDRQSVDDGWGAPTGGGWDDPVPSGGGWTESAPTASATGDWGQPPAPAPSNGLGVYGMVKGSSKRGGAQNAQLPTPTGMQAPASLHPSAAADMSHWGAPPAPDGWGEPPNAWGQPPVPRAATKPAWANWANEAKMSHPQHHRQQSVPHPARVQQAFHPSQQGFLDPQVLAEQHSILRSIQDNNVRANGRSHHGHPQQHSRPQPVQIADSWTHWGKEGWPGERASTIPEEDEEYDEDEDEEWEDDEDGDWGGGHGHDYGNNQRVRFSPNVDYAGRSPSMSSRARTHAPGPASGTSPPPQAHPQVWTPSPVSRTMKMATGSIPSITGTVKTTVFELAAPRNGFGENAFIESHGEALRSAEKALYSRDRPAKDRFRWGFNPDKDPRVGSLLRWIAAMSNGLAAIGVQRYLQTRERGALFANADFRVPTISGTGSQPAFDWIPLSVLQNTLDSTLQSSVTLYDPAFQVIVFVFLLSPSGNSMAVWRRKLNVPDALRHAHQHEILAVKAELKREYPVYVDELPVKPEEATSTAPKKKVRFAFFRRMFGGGKKKDANVA